MLALAMPAKVEVSEAVRAVNRFNEIMAICGSDFRAELTEHADGTYSLDKVLSGYTPIIEFAKHVSGHEVALVLKAVLVW